jgi:hypothetical protein
VVAEREGYEPEQRAVEIQDRAVTVAMELRLRTYALTVEVEPADSAIAFRNPEVSYKAGMQLPPGDYELEVSKPGYVSQQPRVSVVDQDVVVPVKLARESYGLTVNTTPPKSQVTLVGLEQPYEPGLRLTPGTYQVLVEHEGYEPARQSVEITDGDVSIEVVLPLRTYAFRVNATPADSTVRVRNFPERYQAGMRLPPGDYVIEVSRRGYFPHHQVVTVSDQDVELAVVLAPEAYGLTVLTTPADSQVSVLGVETAYQPGMLLPPGHYPVVVTHEGYHSKRQQVRIEQSAVELQVELERIVHALTVSVTPPESQVTVVDYPDAYRPGMLLPQGPYEIVVEHEGYVSQRHAVTIADRDVQMQVDLKRLAYGLAVEARPEGSQVRILNIKPPYEPGMQLPPGEYEVEVSKPGYKPWQQKVAVVDQDVVVPVDLAQKMYSLTVEVEPPDSAIAFRNPEVSYEAGMRLPPGDYELEVSKPGYVSQQPRVSVVNQDVVVPVKLARESYGLTVHTTPPKSQVTLVDYAETYYPGVQLPPGSYEIRVEHDGYESERRTVEIHDKPVELTINLRQAKYELTVVVIPEDSSITIVDYPEPYRPGLALLPGHYEVRVEHEGYTPTHREVTISNRDLTVEISLERVSLVAQPATDEAAQFKAKIAEQAQRLERASDQWSQARQKVVDLKREVAKRERWAEDHQRRFDYYEGKLRDKQDQMFRDPSISLEPERTQYTEAFQQKEQNDDALAQLQERITAAELDLGVLETRVADARNELDALNQQLNEWHVQALYRQIEEPTTIVGRGEYRCWQHLSWAQCKQDALQEAQRDVKDKAMERLLNIIASFEEIPQARREALRQRVEPIILDYRVVKDDWANRTDYFYEIQAEVQGRLPADQRPMISSSTAPVGRHSSSDIPSEPEPRTYSLTVRSMPQDSDVQLLELDTPYRHGMALAPGEYTLLVEATGYQTHQQTIEVRDADITLDVVLKQVETPASNGNLRQALVIGNASYKQEPLHNPLNDAEDMRTTLGRLGFRVDLLRDASHEQMEAGIKQFMRHLRKGGVGLLYYAGHGVQVEGQNYLIPVDAELETAEDVKHHAVPLGWVLERLEKTGNDLNIVILDACRNNPFVRSWRGSYQRGLAEAQAVRGTIIAYATAPGSVARDGEGRNGIYTKHLLAQMRKPGLAIEQVFKQVRIGVQQETNDQQIPWEASSLLGDFYFVQN